VKEGKRDTGLLAKFLLTEKLMRLRRINKGVSYLSYQYSNIPPFPGPDLACRAGIPWAPLRKPYSDRKVFQATRARAGHYSMCEAKTQASKNAFIFTEL